MFVTLFCLAGSYLALTAHQSGSAAMAVHLPALAVAIAARRLPSALAVVWAFGIGLCLDAFGGGLLGIHAAVLVAVVWLVLPLLRDGERGTAWRVLVAVVLIVLADSVAESTPRLISNLERWPELGLELVKTVGVTATAAGMMMFLGGRVFGASCTTR